MRVVLFGAGASHGSGPVYPSSPPLGSRLFNVLCTAFAPSWGAIDSKLARQFASSFEVGMGALLASGSHAVPVLMQEMAMFFAQFRPGQDNAYGDLVNALASAGKLAGTAFASLNYECLLELAASSPHRSINYFGQHVAASRDVTVWKIHGSCNFLPGPEITATRGVSFGAGVSFNTSARAVDPGEVPAYCLGDTALYPAMAHYAKGKVVQIAQPVIQRLQMIYADAVQRADKVAIVGVRPNVDDPHVWRPLASTGADLLVVGDQEEALAWASAHRSKRTTRVLGDRFRSSIAELVDAL